MFELASGQVGGRDRGCLAVSCAPPPLWPYPQSLSMWKFPGLLPPLYRGPEGSPGVYWWMWISSFASLSHVIKLWVHRAGSLDHLSWIAHSLGPDPRPACTLTVSALSHALGYSKPPMLRTGQLRNPQEPLRMRLDSAKAKFRLLKVFGPSSLRLWGLGWGCGDGGGKHVQSTLWVRLDSFPPHSGSVDTLTIISVLQMRKLRCREINDLREVTLLENGSTRGQSQLSKCPCI